MRFFFFLFFVMLFLSSFTTALPDAVIYRSESCGHCEDYLAMFKPMLEQGGYIVIEKNIIGDRANLQELDQLTRERKIPYELQGHMVTVIGRLTLEGHIPLQTVQALLEQYPTGDFPELVLFQDSMEPLVTDYKVLLDDGTTRACTTADSLAACTETTTAGDTLGDRPFLFLVLFNALLAGIHPCTLSVLLFFIAFLFTLRQSRKKIVEVGGAYILGIFLAYFGIGVGLLKAVTIAGTPHFAAQVGATLVLILGVLTLLSAFMPFRFSLGLPKAVKPTVAQLMHRATIPAAFLVGVVVGVCSFGCTAGIYFSIISLLLVKTQYLAGLGYLFLYTLFFILPLIIVLIIAGNKKVVTKLQHLQQHETRLVKIVSGIAMILLALLIWWLTQGGM